MNNIEASLARPNPLFFKIRAHYPHFYHLKVTHLPSLTPSHPPPFHRSFPANYVSRRERFSDRVTARGG